MVLALLCAAVGTAAMIRADDGLRRDGTVFRGVPLETVRAAESEKRSPGVVVAHGFAASKQIMRGFADTLARHGYVVVLLDFAGHGANGRPFSRASQGSSGPSGSRASLGDGLTDDLSAALAFLRALPYVDTAKIGLVGHSMGAGAVLRQAAADPGVAATVAISTGSADGGATGVRDLLVLAGGLELGGIRAAGPALVRSAHPDAVPGRTYGDFTAGTARRAEEIPGVEHIGVLFASATHRATLDWLNAALGAVPGRAASEVYPLHRVGPALLLHLAAVLSFGALASLLLPGRPGRDPRPEPVGGTGLPRIALLAGPVVAGAAAMLVMRVAPPGWLPVEVADYAIGFIAVHGLVLSAAALVGRTGTVRLNRAWAMSRGRTADGQDRAGTGPSPRTPVSSAARSARLVAAAAGLTAFTVLGFAVPAHLGWANSVPSGVRLWLLAPALLAAGALVSGLEILARRRSPSGAVLVHAWGALSVVAAMAVAVVAAGAPGFVVFVIPLFAVLLAWQGVTAAGLRAAGAPVWVTSVVGAALLAWPLALTFPVTT
ncbi:alpha/beta fold hydrolase [Streptosporangium sp. NPDC004379]|uniref:alpha/beta fold hydrolase n=1 Tax=Streptosporangium sp. NPDC004379 TaxID=3366189 RepID=UPI003680C7BC